MIWKLRVTLPPGVSAEALRKSTRRRWYSLLRQVAHGNIKYEVTKDTGVYLVQLGAWDGSNIEEIKDLFHESLLRDINPEFESMVEVEIDYDWTRH